MFEVKPENYMSNTNHGTNNFIITKYDKLSDNIKQISFEISVLAGEIWREHYTSIIGSEQVEYMLDKFQSEKQIYEDIMNNGFVYFTAESIDHTVNTGISGNIKHNKLTGYAACVPKEDYLHLSKLYVHKDYRKNGISRCIIDEMVALCKSRYGLNKIRLYVSKINDGSIAAYIKMGFKNVDTIMINIGNDFYMDDYVMELII